MPETDHSYQTTHSPRGADANFALGKAHWGGGFSLRKARVPQQDVYIGYLEKKIFHCMPFYKEEMQMELNAFGKREAENPYPPDDYVYVKTFDISEVERENNCATDRFTAGRLTFEIITPTSGIRDPQQSSTEEIREDIVPGLLAKITVDNRDNDESVDAVFAVSPVYGKEFLDGNGMVGINANDGYGFATEKAENIFQTSGYQLYALFWRPYYRWALPNVAALVFRVAAGTKQTFPLSLAWYYAGQATFGAEKLRYAYTDFFADINDVHKHILGHAAQISAKAEGDDARLKNSGLNEARQFLAAQSIKAYYTSTMLFTRGGEFTYKVNEGTFMMIDTLDLLVDHAFYELEYQPWVVRDQLDSFWNSYRYYDTVHYPGKKESYPGGVSFCHDQGAFYTFTPCGTSSYELFDMTGVFSYMSQEELCNYILTAAMYVRKTDDIPWLERMRGAVGELFDSMLHRDDADPAKYDGIPDLESDRCRGGSEATTYDNLDESLTSAARGLYISVKAYACYVALAYLFGKLGQYDLLEAAEEQARRASETICSFYDEERGFIPAVLERGKNHAAILPAIEGLIYPVYLYGKRGASGCPGFSSLCETLKKHFVNIFREGICRFEDGGWKMSSTSDIRFTSKIILNQFIAENIFDIRFGDIGRQDRAHADDWRIYMPTNPGWDQTQNRAERNFHYPRAITSVLWLDGKKYL